jgi:cytoskeleton protein RodZ
MTDFGSSFKKARESLGVSLNQIALETRISTRFLLAIENEDFRRLPGGIFNRGFIRAYAERVGLNPDQALADYERLAQNSESDPVLLSPEAQIPQSTPRHLYTVAIGALVLLIAIYYVATRMGNTSSVTAGRPAADAATSAAATAPSQPVTEAPASAPIETPTPAQSQPVTPPPKAAVEPAVASLSPASSPSGSGRDNTLALELDVHEATWIKVSADGATVLNEVLQPGVTRRFTAQTSLKVDLGNAGGLSMKVNDKPVRSLGRSGQVRSLTITSDNLSEITG